MQLRDLHPRRFFIESWRDIDAEATEYRASSGNKGGDLLRAIYVFAVVAISLILMDDEYLGGQAAFLKILDFIDDANSSQTSPFLFALVGWLKPDDGTSIYSAIIQSGYFELWSLGYWASWRVIGFLIIPVIAVIAHPKMKLGESGLSFKGFSKHAWVYGVLFLPVLAMVIILSFTEEFSTYYPFYSEAHLSIFNFVVWEAFYIAQFLSLEFFFRGFMIQPLRRTMGSPVVLAMMIPYVMIHFGKPLPECFAAIIAGVVLGTLALRTRSIWAGFLIHVSVALSMDVAAIWRTNW